MNGLSVFVARKSTSLNILLRHNASVSIRGVVVFLISEGLCPDQHTIHAHLQDDIRREQPHKHHLQSG